MVEADTPNESARSNTFASPLLRALDVLEYANIRSGTKLFNCPHGLGRQGGVLADHPTRTGAFTRALGNPDEAIGLAGLNPHAGENRIFGDQDADILAPAVARARERGINAHGPIPADALVPAAVRGKWKLVIACYHDQGHAPFKAVYGDDGVNITIGLPVVRVSVDHGTAFDIAGKGIARETSLVLSCRRAAQLAPGWDVVWQTARQKTAVPAG